MYKPIVQQTFTKYYVLGNLLGPGEIKSYLYFIKRKTATEFRNNVVKGKEVGDRRFIGYTNLVFYNKTAKLQLKTSLKNISYHVIVFQENSYVNNLFQMDFHLFSRQSIWLLHLALSGKWMVFHSCLICFPQ